MPDHRRLVFATSQQTLRAEALLQAEGFAGLLVLKPKGLVGNCGLALQLDASALARALELLGERQLVPAGVYAGGPDERWEEIQS